MKHRPEIDGLRAIAVAAVVLYHLDFGVPGGYLGVDVFFVISGYLITSIINSDIQRGEFTIAGFYERRVRRIFPALFAMLSMVLVVGWFVLLPRDYWVAMRGSIATTLFGSNWMLWYGAGYFEPVSAQDPLLHTWSLAVEEQFYLFFPLCLLAGYRFFPKSLRAICVITAIVSLAGAAILARHSPNAVFYLPQFRAWELLAGCFVALNGLKPLANKWHRETWGAMGLGAVLFAVFFNSPSLSFPWNAVFAVLGAVALIHSSSLGMTSVSRLLSVRSVTYIGAISYSLYLWHWPIIVFWKFCLNWHPDRIASVGMLVCSLVLAALSYHFVEQPFRRRKVARSRRQLFGMSATAMSLMLVVGTGGFLAHGVPGRFDARTVGLDAWRRPVIPYKSCIELPKQPCVIGDTSARPSIMVWGDSHALSWAPAFDEILKKHRISGYLVLHGACPPLLDVHESGEPRCYTSNAAARDLISRSPELKTVVLAARWSNYFRPSHIVLADGNSRTGNLRVASDGLVTTLKFLKSRGLNAMLVGDAPGALDDVPLSMALVSAHGGSGTRPISVTEVHDRDMPFARVAREVQGHGLATYIDVVPWFCDSDACTYQIGGVPVYRDDNHLSSVGAISREPQMTAALDTILQVDAGQVRN